MEKNCKQCKKEFRKPYYESIRNWETKRKFCSKRCGYDSLKGKAPTHSDGSLVCNKGRIAWNKGKPALWTSGSKHHSWKGGIAAEHHTARNSSAYTQWRTAVYRRDKWTCQDCGIKCQKGNIVAHHLISFVDRKDLRYVVSNGQVLCRPCHARVHAEERNLARSIARSKIYNQTTVA